MNNVHIVIDKNEMIVSVCVCFFLPESLWKISIVPLLRVMDEMVTLKS